MKRAIDEMLICPYCGDGPKYSENYNGCCGESSAHFELVYVWLDTGETLTESELKEENLTRV
jgi:hypothetical protein